MRIFRLPVMLVLFLCLMMYAMHLVGVQVSYALPAKFKLAVGLFMLGMLLIASGGYTFRKSNTTLNPVKPEEASRLVSYGIYRYSRNPQYLGFLLWVTAAAVYSANLLNLVYLPLFMLLANRLYIDREEQALAKRFGQAFDDYKRKVRRWL